MMNGGCGATVFSVHDSFLTVLVSSFDRIVCNSTRAMPHVTGFRYIRFVLRLPGVLPRMAGTEEEGPRLFGLGGPSVASRSCLCLSVRFFSWHLLVSLCPFRVVSQCTSPPTSALSLVLIQTTYDSAWRRSVCRWAVRTFGQVPIGSRFLGAGSFVESWARLRQGPLLQLYPALPADTTRYKYTKLVRAFHSDDMRHGC